jgi:hypothetical protein
MSNIVTNCVQVRDILATGDGILAEDVRVHLLQCEGCAMELARVEEVRAGVPQRTADPAFVATAKYCQSWVAKRPPVDAGWLRRSLVLALLVLVPLATWSVAWAWQEGLVKWLGWQWASIELSGDAVETAAAGASTDLLSGLSALERSPAGKELKQALNKDVKRLWATGEPPVGTPAQETVKILLGVSPYYHSFRSLNESLSDAAGRARFDQAVNAMGEQPDPKSWCVMVHLYACLQRWSENGRNYPGFRAWLERTGTSSPWLKLRSLYLQETTLVRLYRYQLLKDRLPPEKEICERSLEIAMRAPHWQLRTLLDFPKCKAWTSSAEKYSDAVQETHCHYTLHRLFHRWERHGIRGVLGAVAEPDYWADHLTVFLILGAMVVPAVGFGVLLWLVVATLRRTGLAGAFVQQWASAGVLLGGVAVAVSSFWGIGDQYASYLLMLNGSVRDVPELPFLNAAVIGVSLTAILSWMANVIRWFWPKRNTLLDLAWCLVGVIVLSLAVTSMWLLDTPAQWRLEQVSVGLLHGSLLLWLIPALAGQLAMHIGPETRSGRRVLLAGVLAPLCLLAFMPARFLDFGIKLWIMARRGGWQGAGLADSAWTILGNVLMALLLLVLTGAAAVVWGALKAPEGAGALGRPWPSGSRD